MVSPLLQNSFPAPIAAALTARTRIDKMKLTSVIPQRSRSLVLGSDVGRPLVRVHCAGGGEQSIQWNNSRRRLLWTVREGRAADLGSVVGSAANRSLDSSTNSLTRTELGSVDEACLLSEGSRYRERHSDVILYIALRGHWLSNPLMRSESPVCKTILQVCKHDYKPWATGQAKRIGSPAQRPSEQLQSSCTRRKGYRANPVPEPWFENRDNCRSHSSWMRITTIREPASSHTSWAEPTVLKYEAPLGMKMSVLCI